MGESISHDEATKALNRLRDPDPQFSRPEEQVLFEYIAQQRSASGVRVVQIIETNTTNEPLDLMRGGPLKPGQSLAVIERPAEAVKDAGWVKVNEATVARPFTIEADESAEAAAGEGSVSMCMGCLGTGHMEGFGRCPHCKGTGECPHNKRTAARRAVGEGEKP